jgi:endoglucanase
MTSEPTRLPRRAAAIGFAALALLALAAPRARASAEPPAPAPAAERFPLPAYEWDHFKRRFYDERGRVIDTGNGDISHSEGQGYGMLFAEAYGDRRVFDALWIWTKRQLQTRPDDKLLSWRWRPTPYGGGVDDPNNASDGDVLVAWALFRAGVRWQKPAYTAAAREILGDLERTVIVPSSRGLVLLPGAVGFQEADVIVLNFSYYIFPAFARFAREGDRHRWEEVSRVGLALLAESRTGPAGLVPDWSELRHNRLAPAAKFPAEFGYNAVRIPLHLAWSDPGHSMLQPFAAFWRGHQPVSRAPAVVALGDGKVPAHTLSPGMQAIAVRTIAAAAREPLRPRQIPMVDLTEDYYSSALRILTRLSLREQPDFAP